MKDYQKSDYALNKNSEAIVYRSDTGEIIEITKAAFLAANPDMTEQDFDTWKATSDKMLKDTDRADWRQTYKNAPIHGMEETESCATPSLDEQYMEVKDRIYALQAVRQLLDSGKLTEVQRRRFLRYYFEGLTTRQIGQAEGTSHVAVAKSIRLATEKLKKYFTEQG